MDVTVGIVALLLAFVFSFIGVQSSGTTDVNPVGTIAKASQLVIGGITKGQGIDVKKAQKTNLLGTYQQYILMAFSAQSFLCSWCFGLTSSLPLG